MKAFGVGQYFDLMIVNADNITSYTHLVQNGRGMFRAISIENSVLIASQIPLSNSFFMQLQSEIQRATFKIKNSNNTSKDIPMRSYMLWHNGSKIIYFGGKIVHFYRSRKPYVHLKHRNAQQSSLKSEPTYLRQRSRIERRAMCTFGAVLRLTNATVPGIPRSLCGLCLILN